MAYDRRLIAKPALLGSSALEVSRAAKPAHIGHASPNPPHRERDLGLTGHPFLSHWPPMSVSLVSQHTE